MFQAHIVSARVNLLVHFIEQNSVSHKAAQCPG